MPSIDGSHRIAFSLLVLLGVAIGLHVYAVRVRQVKPSREPPITSLSPDGQSRIGRTASVRIKRFLQD
ncbi:MAG: hypothetical protein O2787_09580 [Cyanobacteria bacterium]|nr:hypothetical protein [Cyanobacteriota bacterium]